MLLKTLSICWSQWEQKEGAINFGLKTHERFQEKNFSLRNAHERLLRFCKGNIIQLDKHLWIAIMSKILRHCASHLLEKSRDREKKHLYQIAWDLTEEKDMYKFHFNTVMLRGHVTIKKKEKLILTWRLWKFSYRIFTHSFIQSFM